MDGDLTLSGWESDDLVVQVENTLGSSVTPGRKTAFYQTSLCGTLRLLLCMLIASGLKACTSSVIYGVSSSEYSVACCF